MLTKIRDLRIKTINNGEQIGAYYYDDNKDLWYEDGNGNLFKGHQSNPFKCSQCKYCKRTLIETNNDPLVCRPLPSHQSKCSLHTDSRYDITFSCETYQTCPNFHIAHNYPEWNINQFIDVKNCCVTDFKSVQGFSINGLQLPITFVVSGDDFAKGVVRNNKIYMLGFTMWDEFNYNGKTYHGIDNYIKFANITNKNLIKRIKEEYKIANSHDNNNHRHVVFDLDLMWFSEKIV